MRVGDSRANDSYDISPVSMYNDQQTLLDGLTNDDVSFFIFRMQWIRDRG